MLLLTTALLLINYEGKKRNIYVIVAVNVKNVKKKIWKYQFLYIFLKIFWCLFDQCTPMLKMQTPIAQLYPVKHISPHKEGIITLSHRECKVAWFA